MTKQAALYARISQDREGAGLGVDRQRKDCLALARKLGWSIVAEHTDNDVSAYSGKPRPGYRSLLDDLDSGRANAVLVWHTDRLHRSPRELEEFVDLCERRGVITQTVKAGELDLATPSGRAVARTLGAWARFEVEHKSERTQRAQLQAAQAGRWLGGAPPFGWDLHDHGRATLNRKEAREVRRAAQRLLAGVSLGSVVRDLNERGVTTSTGRPWSYTTLRQVLKRPRNAGLVTYQGEIVAASMWPPLLTEDTWRAVCSLLDNPDRRRSTSNRVRWLLSGLAVCGPCGEPLKSASVDHNKGRPRTVYRCPTPGRGHVGRDAVALDDFVSQLVVARLSQPDALDLLAADEGQVDPEGLRTEAVALRMRLGEAADSFADGAITQAQLARITDRAQRRLADVEAEMARLSRGSVLGPLVAARDPGRVWRGLSIEVRRAVVNELVTVRVMPTTTGRGFDPEAIEVTWR